ncbi:hypothetical protein [Eshraghiella crossota]|uniref:hypothetical protein n=1 Tax=Eshraghiella crossota TaxID=45851 RepID=UPI0040252ED1
MIFKTFDSDKNTFSSKFGIFGKSFEDIGKSFEDIGKSFEDIGNRFKKVSNELIVTNDYTISNIANAWKNSSVKKDLSDKFIITKSDIQDKLKGLSVYEQNPDDILNGLLTQKKLVDANQSSWQDYFNGLKDGEKWQTKFVQENDLTKVSLDDVKNAQNAAKQSAIDYNNCLKQMTIGAKAAKIALNGLKMAGNIIASYLISKAITALFNQISKVIHRSENAIKDLKDAIQEVQNAQDEFISSSKSLSEVEDKFIELSKGVNSYSENIKLSMDDYNEYLKLSQEIADLAPDLVYGYDSQGNALLLIGDNAEQTREKLKELREEQEKQKNQTALDNADKIANGQACSNLSKYSKYGDVSVIEYGGSSLIVKWLAGFPTSGQASYNIGMCNGSGYYQRYKRGGEITENQNLDVIAHSMGEDHIATIAYYNSYQTKMRYYSVQY